jgi:hypothetical protein
MIVAPPHAIAVMVTVAIAILPVDSVIPVFVLVLVVDLLHKSSFPSWCILSPLQKRQGTKVQSIGYKPETTGLAE